MCQFLSAIITRDGHIFADGVLGHTALAEKFDLKENGIGAQAFWEWELTPNQWKNADAEPLAVRNGEEPPPAVIEASERLCRELREANGPVASLPWLLVVSDGHYAVSAGVICAWGSATVDASGSATVEASGSVTVEAWGSATVEAWGSARVKAWGSATVKAWDSATVEAWGSATVEAWDSVTVEAWGSATVITYNSKCILKGPKAVHVDRSVIPPGVTVGETK